MALTSRSGLALLFGITCAAAVAVWQGVAAEGPRLVAQGKKDDATAKEKKDPEPPKVRNFWGAEACIRCHTEGPGGSDDENFVLLTEYTTWRTQDKHSFAYLVLKGARGQRMGELLQTDVSKDVACLSCHAMNTPHQDSSFDMRDGVGCDGCHGPAQDWIGPHQTREWRLKSPAEKEQLGMRNLRDPSVRTALCVSCHVGDPANGKVVTHAMYAAGHPPLPNFEAATFSRNMPQHWRDRRDVPFLKDSPAKMGNLVVNAEQVRKNYHMNVADFAQSQLAVASSVVGLRGSMTAVVGRSDLKLGDERVRWPELTLKGFADLKLPDLWPQVAMAQSDCYACHHELQRPSWRQLRGYSGPPGRPQLRPWPMTLLKQGLGLDESRPEFEKHLADLHAACNVTPFGEPAKVADAAQTLEKWTQGRLDVLKLVDAKFDRRELLTRLCTLGPKDFPDYDSARQIVAAIHVIYTEWDTKPEGAVEFAKVLSELEQEFHLRPGTGRAARLQLIVQQINAGRGKKFLTTAAAVQAVEQLSNRGLGEVFPDKQKQQLSNAVRDFLSALRGDGGKRMNDAIEKDPDGFLKELHTINEKELAEAMSKLAAYDPFVFKKRLEELAKLLAK
ncbi:MAG: hypothetical protein K2R98_25430 [Gemmataceae bacterium]|nr:hypothetical protein [Gemmataceae bacterium]